MARLTIRFYPRDGKLDGLYADIDREQAVALRDPKQNPAAALSEQELESRVFELMFKDFRQAADVEHNQKLLSCYVLWHAGDAEVQNLAGFEDIVFEIREEASAAYNASGIAIRVKLGRREWRALHRRPRAAVPGAGGGFATLAELTLRTFLADPGDINILPPETLRLVQQAGLAQGWDQPNVCRRVFGPFFMQARTRLRETHKLVFDTDFSALVCEAARAEPEKLVAMLNTARAPFEHCWIEWDRQSAITDTQKRGGPALWGAMFTPHEGVDGQYQITLAMQTPKTAHALHGGAKAVVIPGALLINFREALLKPETPPARRAPLLGQDYVDLWPAPRHAAWLDTLVCHVVFCYGSPPYGKPMFDIFGEDQRRAAPAVDTFYHAMAILATSAFREIVAGCALVATHVGGGPLVKELAARGKSTYYKGKFHPPVEYKVIQLARPMPAPHLLRRAFARKPALPARHHAVIGAWHHRRAPNVCPHHPRACPFVLEGRQAKWLPVKAPEEPTDIAPKAEPERHDQQICSLCKRKRWWVSDHARGDPREGLLDKGYEITRSPKPKK
jgi:hypothetical protein